MNLSQSLPITYTAAPTGATMRTGGWRTVSDLLSRVFTLTRKMARSATDNSRLSADTLRDIGLVQGEPPHVGAWDHCPMDYRL